MSQDYEQFCVWEAYNSIFGAGEERQDLRVRVGLVTQTQKFKFDPQKI